MSFPSQRKPRIGGWARFGLSIAAVVSGVLSLVMIVLTVISTIAVIESTPADRV